MITFAIIADDLTGACDSAVKLSSGRKTRVLVEHSSSLPPAILCDSIDAEVVAFNCNTRDLTPQEGASRIFDVARSLTEAGCRNIYKKMDSLMRGNCGAETEAAMRGCRSDLVFVVPAIPWLSRKVVGGRLNVNGEDTGIDARNELQKTSSLAAGNIYRDQLHGDESYLDRLIQDHWKQGVRVLVFDAETEEDLERICRLSKRIPLRVTLAGASGMAAFMDDREEKVIRDAVLGTGTDDWPAETKKHNSPVLLISGSYNEATQRQLEFLEGTCGTVLLTADGTAAADRPEQERERIGRKLEEELIKKRYSSQKEFVQSVQKETLNLIGFSIVCKAGKPVLENKKKIEGFTGKLAEMLMEKIGPQALVLTGGDTACSVMKSLGISELTLIEEVAAGIPVGIVRGGIRDGLMVITKSGSFGEADVFQKILEYLDGRGK